MVPEERLDEYKKKNISVILKQLSEQLSESGNESKITEDDIEFGEEDSDE
jgi:hypothetical protein